MPRSGRRNWKNLSDIWPVRYRRSPEQLRKMPDGSSRKLASGLLVSHSIETDPEGALAFAAQNHDFDYITSDVFQQFAAGDVQAALERAQAIADPNARYQALRGVLVTWRTRIR